MKPFRGQKFTEEALKINGRTFDEIAGFPEPEGIFKEFERMLKKYVSPFNKKDKFFIVGYNSHSFDCQFLRMFFTRNFCKFYGSYFWTVGFDAMILAAHALADKRPNMKNFKLMTVARELGIEVNEDRLHDAEYDILITKAIYKEVTNGKMR